MNLIHIDVGRGHLNSFTYIHIYTCIGLSFIVINFLTVPIDAVYQYIPDISTHIPEGEGQQVHMQH